jgi:hypothetical protein
VDRRERARRHDHSVARRADERRDVALDVSGVSHAERHELDAQRRRDRLEHGKLGNCGREAGLAQYRNARHVWGNLPLSSSSHLPWPKCNSVAQVVVFSGIYASDILIVFPL